MGTPDNTITIILEEGVMITLDAFGGQIAVQVSGKSNEDGCYWMEQDDIRVELN